MTLAPPRCALLPRIKKKTKKTQTSSFSKAVHLVVVDPAVDREVIGDPFWGCDLHFGREP